MRKILSIGLRYGVAIVAFATPILLSYELSLHWKIHFDSGFLLIVVLIAVSWFGGRGPGLTVAILLVVASNLLAPPMFKFKFAFVDVTRIVLLIPLALFVSGRRKAETLINRQREWLSVTLSSIGDAVIATDTHGNLTFINPVAEMLTGWTSATALTRPLDEVFRIVNEHTGEIVQSPVAKVIEQRRVVGLANHTILILKYGQRIPIDDSGAPIRNSAGEITGVVLVFRDVTERKRSEAALAEGERRFRALIEQSSDAICLIGPDGVISYASPSSERVLGYLPTELPGRNGFELIHPDQRDRAIKEFGALLQLPGETKSSETLVQHKDGTWRWTESAGTNLLYESAVGSIVANFRDITERKEAEESRLEAVRQHQNIEEKLKLLVEASEKLLGTMQTDLVQSEILNVAHSLISADAYAVWRFSTETNDWRVVAARGLSDSYCAIVRPKDDRKFELDHTFAIDNVYDSSIVAGNEDIYRTEGIQSMMVAPLLVFGALAGTITFYYRRQRQISETDTKVATALANLAGTALGTAELYEEQNRLRSSAEKANRLKDEFLATVSHELRTPLTAILGWTRILKGGKLAEADISRAIEVIDRNASSQVQIINDLLDMSRIISGKMRLTLEPINLFPVIDAAVETLRPAAEAKSVTLKMDADNSLPLVRADADRFQQITWNLLSNAIRFTPRDGLIEVRVKQAHSHIEITVRDTGAGISGEFLPHVFDRFRQADSSITRLHGGLGLGLAIVRHLTELHGGRVHADSAGEGHGTTFTLQFPISAIREKETSSKQSQVESSGISNADTALAEPVTDLSGLRILVVDDEPDALEVIAVVLTDCGAKVKTTASAGDAIKLVSEWRPDVLVSDIGMPDEDGYTFIRRVRALNVDQGGQTPAAALTAYARVEDEQKALDAGYQIHLAKPVDPSAIAAVVASLAGRSRSGASLSAGSVTDN